MSTVSLRLLEAGYCRVPEFLSIRGGSLRPVRFPASVAVIEHPREGVILFDTGYSPRFHGIHSPDEVTQWFKDLGLVDVRGFPWNTAVRGRRPVAG